MSASTRLTFDHQPCPAEPATTTVAAYFTLTYGDFTVKGFAVVRKGETTFVRFPGGVSLPDEGRRQAFNEYALKSWRNDLRQLAVNGALGGGR